MTKVKLAQNIDVLTDFFPQWFASGEYCASRDEPTIANSSLVGIVRGGAVDEETRRFAQILSHSEMQ